jgi:hypothetical protein
MVQRSNVFVYSQNDVIGPAAPVHPMATPPIAPELARVNTLAISSVGKPSANDRKLGRP